MVAVVWAIPRPSSSRFLDPILDFSSFEVPEMGSHSQIPGMGVFHSLVGCVDAGAGRSFTACCNVRSSDCVCGCGRSDLVYNELWRVVV